MPPKAARRSGRDISPESAAHGVEWSPGGGAGTPSQMLAHPGRLRLLKRSPCFWIHIRYPLRIRTRLYDAHGYNRKVHRITKRQLKCAANALTDLVGSLD